MTETHFNDEDWFDFVRQLNAPDKANRMQQHVDRGCEHCRSAFALWHLVTDVANCESNYRAPDSVVRSVKSAFELRRKIAALPQLAEMARLVFDTFGESMPAGVRGGGAVPARHLLHEAGSFVIDLWLEQEEGERAFAAGQVIHTDRPKTVTGTGVVLVDADNRLLEHTIANSLGEFHLEFDYHANLKLFLDIPDAGVIGIVVPTAKSG